MDTVYLETTIIGHLAGRLHADPVIAFRQETTRNWFATESLKYRLYISAIVRDECSAGDPTGALERLDAIGSIPLLEITNAVRDLADKLTAAGAVPPSEPRDALHIAVAAVNGIQYLLTWNFRHIASATMRPRIEAVCRTTGYDPPIICTPSELGGDENGI